MKIAYIFTTFPVLSETFLQRELRHMLKENLAIDVFSLWGGEQSWEGTPIQRASLWQLTKLIYLIPYWGLKKPNVFRELLETLWSRTMPNLKNLAETMLGLGMGIVYAHHFEKKQFDHIHAVWATMPTSTAWLIHKFTGIPYSMGAHAYDVFQDGGDWMLEKKLKTATFVHTSTQATRARLLSLGADPSKVKLIRRGLNQLPEFKTWKSPKPVQLISVGRLVEKKGHHHQLKIYHQLKLDGLTFKAKIVGAGPLEKKIKDSIVELNLSSHVELIGKLDYSEILRHYNQSDIFIFTGVIAPDGDRDGLPNVIPEAMAAGLIVITSPVSGTTEAVENQETGFVIPPENSTAWSQRIQQIVQANEEAARIQKQARKWVEQNFMADTNARRLAELFECTSH